ncbi:Bro-N domain-containing protein [Pseudomonas viridiflava]|uniref:BRO-N domain-containing protein n=1 Tax=Pseudomonas viridiflava TaxID=33069 RepID=UPI003BA8FE27
MELRTSTSQLSALPVFSQVGFMERLPLNERTMRKLDADQYRMMTLEQHSGPEPELMVSESGAYAMLVHHYHAENRGLRQWLTHEVVPMLRDAEVPSYDHAPHLSMLQWPGLSVSVLHWQSEPWIRLRDMPLMLAHPQMQMEPTPRQVSKPWWRSALPVFRLG